MTIYSDETKERAALHIWSKLKSIDIKKYYPIITPEMNQSVLDGKNAEKVMLQYIASLIEKDYNITFDLI